MSRIICLAIVLATPLLIAADTDDAVRKELKALEGTWKTVAVEAGGQSFTKDQVPAFTFIIGAEGKATGRMPQGEYRSTITVDPKKNLKTIDNHHESGDQKGKNQYGVYKLDGDKLTVNMTPPGKAEGDRPKDFDTKNSPSVLFVFERAKEERKP